MNANTETAQEKKDRLRLRRNQLARERYARKKAQTKAHCEECGSTDTITHWKDFEKEADYCPDCKDNRLKEIGLIIRRSFEARALLRGSAEEDITNFVKEMETLMVSRLA
jgi:hypothetical protein